MLPRCGAHGSAGKLLRHNHAAALLLQQQPQEMRRPAVASLLSSFFPSFPSFLPSPPPGAGDWRPAVGRFIYVYVDDSRPLLPKKAVKCIQLFFVLGSAFQSSKTGMLRVEFTSTCYCCTLDSDETSFEKYEETRQDERHRGYVYINDGLLRLLRVNVRTTATIYVLVLDRCAPPSRVADTSSFTAGYCFCCSCCCCCGCCCCDRESVVFALSRDRTATIATITTTTTTTQHNNTTNNSNDESNVNINGERQQHQNR